MNCIIIDDEPLARKGIQLLIEQVPYLSCAGEFGNPVTAHEFLTGHDNIDLIFLDIEMPGLTGLEYLQSMPPDSQVILTTAYPQYALEAFELDVVDYLLKPVKLHRFLKAVQKVRDIKELSRSEVELPPKEAFIYIKSDRKYIKLFYSDIHYIKGLKDYVVIYTPKQKFMTAMNVGTIHRQLPDDIFARVSKSYIINVNYVNSIDLDSIILGENEIPLGNSYKEAFLSKFVKDKLIKR